MKIKQIKETLLNQCKGDQRMATDLYRQIQLNLKDTLKALKNIYYLEITRNDYLDGIKYRPVIHMVVNNISCETCLGYRY